MPLLTAAHLQKSYAGIAALKDASLELRGGEVHALVGENGAGKSTLIKILTGAVIPDGGELHLDGKLLADHTPHRAHELGIAAIYQQPALFADLTVAENLALAYETGSPWRVVRWRERDLRARELLAQIGARIHPQAPVSDLRMAEQQLVEIARALGGNTRVLILDEPTASLTGEETQRLFQIIRDLRTRGVGLIYISHRLDELFEVADRVTVLRDGAVVGTHAMADLDRSRIIQMMAGRELSQVFPKTEAPIGEVVLETRGLRSSSGGVRDVSLTLRRGETLGLAGMVGSGRTQFAEALFGLAPVDGGSIHIAGREVSIPSPGRAIELGLAYVPEDRRRHGVIMNLPIPANVTLATIGTGFLHPRRERRLAHRFQESLRIKARSLTLPVSALSGGNQQKVALARWLATKPRILILDEPTQGIDVGAKAEIHAQMCRLARDGLAILMISSELPEILGMSDRIAVMRNGAIAGVLSRSDASPESILALALEDRAA